MARVDPGELKWRIQILVPDRRRDGNDHYSRTEHAISLRAAIRATNSSGGDVIEYGAARAEERVQFIVRWRADLNSDMTVLWQGRRYAIDFIDPTPWAGGYMRIKAVGYDAGVGE